MGENYLMLGEECIAVGSFVDEVDHVENVTFGNFSGIMVML